MLTPTGQAPPPAFSLELDASRVAWLSLDRQDSAVNTLSRAVLEELAVRLAELRELAPRGLVLLSGKEAGFIAGADIQEFTALTDVAQGYALVRAAQAVLDRLAALPCPTVAAIHGYALGGGLELALACRYRVAASDAATKLGLPEVKLGIHPGFGGTVRSVRLIGARAALKLMLAGASVGSAEALALGLIDASVPLRELRTAAVGLIEAQPARRAPPLLDRLLSLAPARPLLAAKLKATLRRRVAEAHYPASYAIVELWQAHGAHGPAAYAAEASSVARLFVTPTARALIRVFFLQNRLKAQGRPPSGISRVRVIGAGVMGGDIAAWCAASGFAVTLADQSERARAAALERAQPILTRRLKDPARIAAAQARLTAGASGTTVTDDDLVIEAIAEQLSAKQALYLDLEPGLGRETLLATNTSSLSLEALSRGLRSPGRLVGLHFFNPVARMPLVEVVHQPATDPALLARATAFVRELDKLPLPCRSSPGFLVNRVLFAYLMEALRAANEGLAPALIDAVAVGFGMPQGPVELADTIGLDVAQSVAWQLGTGAAEPALGVLSQRVAAGELGKKSGRGFYRWVDGKPHKPPSRAPAPADLEDRLVLALLNEACACLRERVVEDEDLLDAGIIFGTGFAPFRGGPLAYARARGIEAVVAALRVLEVRYGTRFSPDPGWSGM